MYSFMDKKAIFHRKNIKCTRQILFILENEYPLCILFNYTNEYFYAL